MSTDTEKLANLLHELTDLANRIHGEMAGDPNVDSACHHLNAAEDAISACINREHALAATRDDLQP